MVYKKYFLNKKHNKWHLYLLININNKYNIIIEDAELLTSCAYETTWELCHQVELCWFHHDVVVLHVNIFINNYIIINVLVTRWPTPKKTVVSSKKSFLGWWQLHFSQQAFSSLSWLEAYICDHILITIIIYLYLFIYLFSSMKVYVLL